MKEVSTVYTVEKDEEILPHELSDDQIREPKSAVSSHNTVNWHIAYCMQDVHNKLLYCNTDLVIIKPVTGRASVCSTSVKTTRSLIALGFHTEKEACQHSHSSDPVPVHTICTIHCNILPYTIH